MQLLMDMSGQKQLVLCCFSLMQLWLHLLHQWLLSMLLL
jgi:hypothetical protein